MQRSEGETQLCFTILFEMVEIQLINMTHSWTVHLKHGM
jgi:hypothetical protein